MSDELKAAVERWRSWTKYNPPAGYTESARRSDEHLLSQWCIAEHPADDDAPIDEAWLRSVGFESCPNEAVIVSPDSPSGLRVMVNISPTIRFGRVTVFNENAIYPAAHRSAYLNNN